MKERILSFVISLAIIATVLTLYFNLLEPLKKESYVEFVIRRGETAEDVAFKLKERGIIGDPLVFILFSRITGLGKKIKYGKYFLSRNLSPFRVLFEITREGAGRVEEVVTIFEGYTLRDIARVLSEKVGIDTGRFLYLARDPVFITKLARIFPLLDNPPSLEGYLFPDTYKFAWGDSEEEIIERMVGRLFEVWTPRFTMEAESLHMTLHDVLTLASIIEKEAAVDRERFIISGVFHNRLKRGIPLQSCATIEYILPRRKPILSYSDLRIESPYNTYLHKGLPPTPICSPGLISIIAALRPAKVDYLYFVSRGDGTHLFARTLKEHERNKRIVRQLHFP